MFCSEADVTNPTQRAQCVKFDLDSVINAFGCHNQLQMSNSNVTYYYSLETLICFLIFKVIHHDGSRLKTSSCKIYARVHVSNFNTASFLPEVELILTIQLLTILCRSYYLKFYDERLEELALLLLYAVWEFNIYPSNIERNHFSCLGKWVS